MLIIFDPSFLEDIAQSRRVSVGSQPVYFTVQEQLHIAVFGSGIVVVADQIKGQVPDGDAGVFVC